MYKIALGNITYTFSDLKDLMAKATPLRSGDELAGIAARSMEEHVAAQMCLANVPLRRFLEEPLIPYEEDLSLIHISEPTRPRCKSPTAAQSAC